MTGEVLGDKMPFGRNIQNKQKAAETERRGGGGMGVMKRPSAAVAVSEGGREGVYSTASVRNATETWFQTVQGGPAVAQRVKNLIVGVPIMAQRKQIQLVSVRMQVQFLASLKIRRCHELPCMSQVWLGPRIAWLWCRRQL